MNFETSFDDSFDDDIELTSDNDQGGIIIPKQTCEHVQYVQLLKTIKSMEKNQCIDCESTKENWLCLSCGEIHCSRYVNNHGKEHWLFTLLTDEQYNMGHCLTISLQDLSVWCYPCKSYIKNLGLNSLIKKLQTIKFGSDNQTSFDQTNSLSPKKPSTIIAIQDHSLVDILKKTDLLSYCYTIKLRSASIDELVCLHSSDYVNMIVSAEKGHEDIPDKRFSIEYNETTFSNARISAGITIDVIENVLNNHTNGFILSTTPGHRAFIDHGNGTSIYNNIALAINSVLSDKMKNIKRKTSLALIDSNNHVHMEGATPIEDAICHIIHVITPLSTNEQRLHSQMTAKLDKDNDSPDKIQIDRVLILDLTSEHGCGLQSIYYESNQVFYISIHKENHQHRSSYHECGKNNGAGYTINIPLLSLNDLTDHDYLTIFNEIILPITKEFQPELIVICLDFQIEKLTTLFYAWIIEQLSIINNSKLVIALDGNLSCISSKNSYIETVLSVLIGKLSFINNDQWKNLNDIDKDVCEKINLIKTKHKQYWPCLQ